MNVIGIIGAGQLGSRHLQSLAGVEQPLEIYVLDISEQSLNVARERFEEVRKRSDHVVHYINGIDRLPGNFDIVIVATNSTMRRALVESLLAQCKVNHLILEKFLFPRLHDYEVATNLFAGIPDMKVWVNCPRRTFDLYKEIAEKVSSQGAVYFSVTGGAWGLGCNSIHFVDVFSKLINDSGVQVLNESLDNEYIDSKRSGYVEFSGSLYLGAINGPHKMEVISFQQGTHPIIVKISTPTAYWIINETAKEVVHATATDGWKPVTHSFSLPALSIAGTKIAVDLLSNGHCDLTPYKASAALHQCLLEVFLEKYNSIKNETNDICPIT